MNRAATVAVALLLFSCGHPDYNWSLNKHATINLTGRWTEYWSQVEGHDIYLVEHPENGAIRITCPTNDHYSFSDIRLEGNDFSFRLTNRVDTADLYILDYALGLSNDQQTLKGHVKTNHGVKDRVRLVKD